MIIRLDEDKAMAIDGDDDDSSDGGVDRQYYESAGESEDDEAAAGSEAADDGCDAFDYKSLARKNLSSLMLSEDQWKESTIFEAIMEPAAEALTRLQPGKYNLIHAVLQVLVQLRRHFGGEYFRVSFRPSDYRKIRQGDYDCSQIHKDDLFLKCPFAETLCSTMINQLNLRFLHVNMPKWIYIAALLNPSIYNLGKLFLTGDAVQLADARQMLEDELLDVVRRHFPGADQPPLPDLDSGAAGASAAAGDSASPSAAQTVRRMDRTSSLLNDLSSSDDDDAPGSGPAPPPPPAKSKMQLELGLPWAKTPRPTRLWSRVSSTSCSAH
jgi:hypothetical protein